MLRELDPAKPAHGLYALADLVGATYARDRQLTLAALGVSRPWRCCSRSSAIHGVLSHRVRERTREIGIRMAVGASRAHVLRLVAGHGPALVALGVVLGAPRSRCRSPGSCRALLFGTSRLDPAARVGRRCCCRSPRFVVSLHPAWRAARIDAAEVLRAG